MRRVMAGSGSEYISITSMMVESAALYTANGLIFLVSYAVNSPIQNLALPVLGQTQVRFPILATWENDAQPINSQYPPC